MDDLDGARWAAVEARSEGAVGVFLYAARTTGVYCVPTCPSRRPLRKNVVFFATGAEAVAAGYRACRRCHPNRERSPSPSVAAVVAVCRRIENPDDDPPVAELARRAGWSQRHLSRMFKDTVGVTISAYRRTLRGERARDALRRGVPVTDAVFDAGYGSMRAFYESAGSQMGVTPTAFSRGSPGTRVQYTVFSAPMGEILVAATGRGVCAVRIGETHDDLRAELLAECPRARVEPSDGALDGVVSIVRDLARGQPAAAGDLPLDLQGSTFQVAVWQALRTIPAGTTVTYGELTARIGRPESHRAVGGACGANPAALVVPCHRVVRADGSTGGYRWGEGRKRELLAAESSHTPAATAVCSGDAAGSPTGASAAEGPGSATAATPSPAPGASPPENWSYTTNAPALAIANTTTVTATTTRRRGGAPPSPAAGSPHRVTPAGPPPRHHPPATPPERSAPHRKDPRNPARCVASDFA